MNIVVEHYTAFFEQMQPSDLDRFGEVFAAQARFRDLFNDVRELDATRAVFAHMYVSCSEPRFVVPETTELGRTAWLRWCFEFSAPLLGERSIEGASRVCFDATGLAEEHVHYWDAAELFETLPGLGGPLSWLRRRCSATGGDSALRKR